MIKKSISCWNLLLLLFTLVAPIASATADDIPMTIDGQINCAHPANAITTTCKGEALPAPVATPTVTHEAKPPAPTAPATSTPAPAASSIPLTIDGEINCAHPDNSITTTCWDRAQASKIFGQIDKNAVDCTLPQNQDFPVCTGVKPQAVVDYEKSRENAAALPATNTDTFEFEPVDCSSDTNKESPYCLPMTINGEINCAQAANAITTTCWDQALKEKAAGRLFPNGVDCTKDAFKTYPVCTGVKPKAVVDFEKSQQNQIKSPVSNTQCSDPANINLVACLPSAIADAGKKIDTEQAQIKEPEKASAETPKPQVSGSIDLKTRNTKTTVMVLDLDTANAKVKIVATKKGSPSITQQITADSEGNKTVKFSKNLKGYTVKIYVGSQMVDQTKIS